MANGVDNLSNAYRVSCGRRSRTATRVTRQFLALRLGTRASAFRFRLLSCCSSPRVATDCSSNVQCSETGSLRLECSEASRLEAWGQWSDRRDTHSAAQRWRLENAEVRAHVLQLGVVSAAGLPLLSIGRFAALCAMRVYEYCTCITVLQVCSACVCLFSCAWRQVRAGRVRKTIQSIQLSVAGAGAFYSPSRFASYCCNETRCNWCEAVVYPKRSCFSCVLYLRFKNTRLRVHEYFTRTLYSTVIAFHCLDALRVLLHCCALQLPLQVGNIVITD